MHFSKHDFCNPALTAALVKRQSASLIAVLDCLTLISTICKKSLERPQLQRAFHKVNQVFETWTQNRLLVLGNNIMHGSCAT